MTVNYLHNHHHHHHHRNQHHFHNHHHHYHHRNQHHLHDHHYHQQQQQRQHQQILTHNQTTNFLLFQTERVCRRQFQIWRKWKKFIQTGRKHCGKRRNCSLRAISPFPTVFSKGLFPRGIKWCHCMGMGWTLELCRKCYTTTTTHIKY